MVSKASVKDFLDLTVEERCLRRNDKEACQGAHHDEGDRSEDVGKLRILEPRRKAERQEVGGEEDEEDEEEGKEESREKRVREAGEEEGEEEENEVGRGDEWEEDERGGEEEREGGVGGGGELV